MYAKHSTSGITSGIASDHSQNEYDVKRQSGPKSHRSTPPPVPHSPPPVKTDTNAQTGSTEVVDFNAEVSDQILKDSEALKEMIKGLDVHMKMIEG